MAHPLAELTPELIRRIYDAAVAGFDRDDEDEDEDDDDDSGDDDPVAGLARYRERQKAKADAKRRREPPPLDYVGVSKFGDGLRGLRLAAALYGLSADLDGVPVLVHTLGWRLWKGIDDEREYRHKDLRAALSRRVWRGAPPPEVFERICRHPDPQLRRAVANGLDVRQPDALALRLRLALHDPDPAVRAMARRDLPADVRPAWWRGSLPSEDALGETVPEPVQTGLTDIDRYWTKAQQAAFEAGFATLSEPARHRLATAFYAPRCAIEDLLLDTLMTTSPPPGSTHGLVAVLARLALTSSTSLEHTFKQAWATAAPRATESARQTLLAALRDFIASYVCAPHVKGYPVPASAIATKVYLAALGEVSDPHALLDLALTVAGNRTVTDPVAQHDAERDGLYELTTALQPALAPTSPHANALLDRFFAALETQPGLPPAWRALRWVFQDALKARFATDAGRAERARLGAALLASTDPETLELGITWSLAAGSDPDTLAQDPRLAAAFAPLGKFSEHRLAHHRRALRAGELTPEEVVAVCKTIDWKFGGLLSTFVPPPDFEFGALGVAPGRALPARGDAALVARMPEALRGPRDDVESALFEAAVEQLAASAAPEERAKLLADFAARLRPGPFTGAERQALERAMDLLEACIARAPRRSAHDLLRELLDCLTVLAQKTTEADLPSLMAWMARVPDPDEHLAGVTAWLSQRFGAALPPIDTPRRSAVRGGTWRPTRAHATPSEADDSGATAESTLPGLPAGVARRALLGLLESFRTDNLELYAPEIAYRERSNARALQRSLCALLTEVTKGLAWALAADDHPATWDALIGAVEDGDIVDFSDSAQGVLRSALEMILSAATPGPELAKLVTHNNVAVRQALAEALDAADVRARALLFELMQDADPDVRQAATESLEGYERPWWLGVFVSDPIATLGPEEAAEAAPALAELAAWFGPDKRTHRYDADYWTSVAATTRRLPPALTVEVLARLLPTASTYHPAHAPLIIALLQTPGGAPALLAYLERELSNGAAHYTLARVLAGALAAPPEGTTANRRELAEGAVVRLRRLIAKGGRTDEARALFANVVASTWPDDADPEPLLDLVLELRPTKSYIELHDLEARLFKTPWRADWRTPARVIEAAKAGFKAPGWSASDTAWLERVDPDRRREVALVHRVSEDTALWQWAWTQLLGPLHVPEDAPIASQVAELVADPASVDRIYKHAPLVRVALPLLRERLRLGMADLRQASITLEAAYVADGAYPDDLLTPWRVARDAAAAQLPSAGPERAALIHAHPHHLFEAEERALLHRLAADADAREAYMILLRFSEQGSTEDLPVARSLVQRNPTEYLKELLGKFEQRMASPTSDPPH